MCGGNKGRDRGDENRDGVGGYKDSDVGSKDEREILLYSNHEAEENEDWTREKYLGRRKKG